MNRKECLEQASKITQGERQENYGTPEDNFKRIADLWSIYLEQDIAPHDVAAMMSLMKIARLMNQPNHQDSWVDLAGYAACGCEITTKEPTEFEKVLTSTPYVDVADSWVDFSDYEITTKEHKEDDDD